MLGNPLDEGSQVLLHRERMTMIVMGVALCVQGIIIFYLLPKKPQPPSPITSSYEFSSDPETNYWEGMTLFSQQGLEKAQDFFQAAFQESGNPLYFFGLAWLDYRAENYEKAEKRVDYLLISEQDDSAVKAYAYFLGGYLAYDQGDAEKGFQLFQHAETLNRMHNREIELFRNRMGMALCKSLAEEFEEAKAILAKAYDANLKNPPSSLVFFYQLSGHVENQLGHHLVALEMEKKCSALLETSMVNNCSKENVINILDQCPNISEHERDLGNWVYSQYRLAFYLFTIGEMDLADSIQERATAQYQRIEMSEPIEKPVLIYLMDKCRGFEPTYTDQEIMRIVEQRGNAHQKYVFRNLSEWSCNHQGL